MFHSAYEQQNSDFTLNSSIITEEILASPAYIIDTTSSSLEKKYFLEDRRGGFASI